MLFFRSKLCQWQGFKFQWYSINRIRLIWIPKADARQFVQQIRIYRRYVFILASDCILDVFLYYHISYIWHTQFGHDNKLDVCIHYRLVILQINDRLFFIIFLALAQYINIAEYKRNVCCLAIIFILCTS